MVKRRGAFDIGSGATKLQVSDVTADGLIVKTLFGEERPCAFGADWLKSTDDCLSSTIQEKGIKTINDLKLIGDNLGVESYAVIATEVFRKAANGHIFLDKVRALGMKVTVISQEMEAELGYVTAVAYGANQGPHTCVAWDSGGGSFQISTLSSEEHSFSEHCSSSSGSSDITLKENKLLMYMGAFGSGIATATLIEELQGRQLSKVSSPNPVSLIDVERLIITLTNKMDENIPDWLINCPQVTAIGGPNSIFQLACNVLTIMKRQSQTTELIAVTDEIIDGSRDPGREECVEEIKVDSFTLSDVRTAIDECVDRSDDYLKKFISFPNADPTTIIVPKLCLLYSVMKRTGIQKVKAVCCIGSCGGVLVTEKFYT